MDDGQVDPKYLYTQLGEIGFFIVFGILLGYQMRFYCGRKRVSITRIPQVRIVSFVCSLCIVSLQYALLVDPFSVHGIYPASMSLFIDASQYGFGVICYLAFVHDVVRSAFTITFHRPERCVRDFMIVWAAINCVVYLFFVSVAVYTRDVIFLVGFCLSLAVNALAFLILSVFCLSYVYFKMSKFKNQSHNPQHINKSMLIVRKKLYILVVSNILIIGSSVWIGVDLLVDLDVSLDDLRVPEHFSLSHDGVIHIAKAFVFSVILYIAWLPADYESLSLSEDIPILYPKKSMISSASSLYPIRENDERLDSTFPIEQTSIHRDSQILDDEQFMLLLDHLPDRYKWGKYFLLFSSNFDQNSYELMFDKGENNGQTVLIVKTKDGDIVGGFSTHSWQQDYTFFGSGDSFMFAFRPHLMKFAWERENEYFMFHIDQKAVEKIPAPISLTGDTGYGYMEHTRSGFFSYGSAGPVQTRDTPVILCQRNQEFEIDEFEVWAFDMNYVPSVTTSTAALLPECMISGRRSPIASK